VYQDRTTYILIRVLIIASSLVYKDLPHPSGNYLRPPTSRSREAAPPSNVKYAFRPADGAARVDDPTKKVKPDHYLHHLQGIRALCHTSLEFQQDEALAVSSGKEKKRKLRGECWNCGEKPHFKDKCPPPPRKIRVASFFRRIGSGFR
jgi:hypothetical protein